MSKRQPVENKWRISPFADLSGRGGMIVSGRWHSQGHPVVYLSESPAAALLETLVHLELGEGQDLPEAFQLLQVGFHDDVSIIELDPNKLPAGWKDNVELTQRLGDQWLEEADSLLLQIPSAVAPLTKNYLFNPQHPDAEQADVEVDQHPYDKRLFHRR